MDHEIELRHLRYFVAVAEELHFGRAAQRLHLAQPPLSQQIRKLEDLVGHALFERTSRSVRLTAAGQSLLEGARRTMRNLERGIDETRSAGRGEVGSLHVGFVSSAVLTFLPDLFRKYREAYPLVRLHLHESFTSRVIEGLESGILDAGIVRDADANSRLRIEPVRTEPFVAAVPAAHPLARQKSVSVAALRNEPFVYFPRSAGTRAYDLPFAAHGFQPNVVQEATHWLTILRLVGAGLGVTVGPDCIRKIGVADVVFLRLRGAAAPSQIELARMPGDSRPIVEQFARIVEGN